ncbi:IclR family transcriptional regulator [Paenarthrobacter sp. NPDC058040]|uniref:IclR family transcriptional regulator n=1 Tax=unclassified Paenarthrobacter TaxID=2634190 RepID=UPI0036DA6786
MNDRETDIDPELSQLNRSALRAASLLISVGEHPDGASAAQLAIETDVPRPTAFRILQSLVHTGLLAREGGTFKLGWRTAHLGRLADPYRDILPRVQVILDGLAAKVNESVEFVMFTSSTTQETIAQASSTRLLAPSQQYVGRSFPLHATATGRILLANVDKRQIHSVVPAELDAMTEFTITDRAALLAELDKARIQGFATLDGELEEGLFVVAVPVHDGQGRLVAGLAASGLSQRMKSTDITFYVETLRADAARLGMIVSPS